jgi:biopolymer transport protein ExbD
MSSRIRVVVLSGTLVLAIGLFVLFGSFLLGLTENVAGKGVTVGSLSWSAPSNLVPVPAVSRLKSASASALAPDAPAAAQFDQQYADYERIHVDVHRDGSLTVLGREMAVEELSAWLHDQRDAEINTCVSVRPESDCQFRHVGQVLRTCEDLGIPTHMLVEPTRRQEAPAQIADPA